MGEADPPGGAGGDLFAGDEAVVQPAQQRGGGDAELFGGGGHVEQLSFRRVVAGLVAGDLPVVPQRLDPTGGERQSAGCRALLAVEDSGDGGVGVVHGQPAQQVDGVLVGADLRLTTAQRHGELADRAALPAQHQLGVRGGVLALQGDVDFLKQSTQ